MSAISRFTASIAALLASLGCGPRGVPATELASVSDAAEATEATHLSFTGQAKTEWFGKHTWAGVRHPRGVGRGEDAASEHAMWVVPVFDPGAEPGDEVALWLTASGNHKASDSPDAWFAEIRERFDGRRHTLKVRGRASDEGAGWVEAIRDAEKSHGIRSHGRAAVVPWPPK